MTATLSLFKYQSMENSPRKVEIFHKAPVGFTLHLLNLLLTTANFALTIVYFESDQFGIREANYLLIKAIIQAMSVLHAFYSLTFLIAPRFAIKGSVFWKTSPWLMSGIIAHGLPFLTVYRDMPSALYWTIFPLTLVLFLCLYIGVFLRMDHPMVSFLRPYVFRYADNPLAIEGALETAAFGPPLLMNSTFAGQPPVTMRYGSHASFVPGKI